MSVLTSSTTPKDEQHTWRSLFLGIAVWFLYQNTLYALASLSCVWGWFSFQVAGIPGLRLVEAGLTVVALALMLLLTFLPWREWRRFQTDRAAGNPRLLQDTEKGRRPLVAFIVMLLNGLFCLFVIAAFVPIIALNACSQA